MSIHKQERIVANDFSHGFWYNFYTGKQVFLFINCIAENHRAVASYEVCVRGKRDTYYKYITNLN